ncbi:hypothetical protein BJ165DRAFT_1477762 [Panaeolus papilionaceus]|nr:hypothetical protein BJ165DRAFT_1477762 [Panaeolus papilionaceus]
MVQNIWDSACNNTLTKPDLERYLKEDPNCLNKLGGDPNAPLTPLACACHYGHLDTVLLLLEKGSRPDFRCPNGRTALYYAIMQAPQNQVAIVEALLDARPGGAGPDEEYPKDNNINALHLAIVEARDSNIVQALVNRGAHPTPDNEARAKTREISLVPLNPIPVVPVDVPEPKSAKDFKNNLDNFIKGAGLESFYADKPGFLEELSRKASALRDNPDTDLGKPENIQRLTTLSLYQLVIYCDDSGSMSWNTHGDATNDRHKTRYHSLCQLVSRITRIATLLLPPSSVVKVRFINNPSQEDATADQVGRIMQAVSPSGGTPLGSSLENKILQPMVYNRISNPAYKFQQPLLVCTITDGTPNRGDTPIKDVVLRCRRALVSKGYDPDSVMFCISQIGTDAGAKAFLDAVKEEKEISDVVYCTSDQLDVTMSRYKNDERALDVWLLGVLSKPIMRGR